ncbi:type II toxin-antitoxin system VapC family toxin [filamentous cyanobacterium LEGE 11480]|uniref:Type II toxin-antitoxin system VapC family toxin n=1 Tax=Romeriopsis navalis LEGE 11480 TaxID=2777977 RepID=A0A928VTY5_9CYAN|nr:type II toxin-antitoxin system VapC family toxin [Romeriopsis navalis LEGE 11480]
MRYLIDTNILSEPLKPQPNLLVVGHLRQHSDEIAIAATTWHEIRYGCELLPVSKRRDGIETYLKHIQATLPILPYDHVAAAWQATERARLKNQPPAFQDSQIAAVAAVNQLILVTNNVADFVNFHGLTIANWFEAE